MDNFPRGSTTRLAMAVNIHEMYIEKKKRKILSYVNILLFVSRKI